MELMCLTNYNACKQICILIHRKDLQHVALKHSQLLTHQQDFWIVWVMNSPVLTSSVSLRAGIRSWPLCANLCRGVACTHVWYVYMHHGWMTYRVIGVKGNAHHKYKSSIILCNASCKQECIKVLTWVESSCRSENLSYFLKNIGENHTTSATAWKFETQ